MPRRILVTSALPYVNGHIHLGHLVEYLQTDIFVRFLRMCGHEVAYICADDVHGTATMMAARQRGVPEAVIVAEMGEAHRRDFADFDIRFDYYGSTDSDSNRESVYAIWEALRAGGHVTTREVTQLYDPVAGVFLADRFVKGACPRCGAPEQYGDSCDKCAATFAPTELKDPVSTLSGARPELRSAPHWFVVLERFRPFLERWVNDGGHLHPDMARWVTNTFLRPGEPLRDWDVSRPAPYFGFPIPDAPGHYFYVWLDAPVGYVAATRDWCAASGQDWRRWWQDPATEIHHVIGKDIAYFHTLFWPAMLSAVGWNLPSKVHIHGFLTVNGEKMSKSKGTFVRARTYLEHLDPQWLRYYYAAKLDGTASDLDLQLDEFVAKVNADLVGKVVNLASRTARFVPRLAASYPEDGGLFARAAAEGAAIAAAYERLDTASACRLIMAAADRANEFVERAAPWNLHKDPARHGELAAVCTVALNLFRQLCVYLAPVLPRLAAGCGELLSAPIARWEDAAQPLVDRPIAPYRALLTRVEAARVAAMIEASKAPETVARPAAAPPAAPSAPVEAPATAAASAPVEALAPTISFEEFAKVDLRVAEVLAAEEVPKAKKILKLRLGLGPLGERTVFAGIKAAFPDPRALLGRRIVIVANLAPRAMSFGVSEGMVLAAGEGPACYLLSPDPGAQPGQRLH
ncbi:MAG: methionine--tRNA ligase [Planctomycetota bacterium]|nr:methionine--tRNA ligase [Planctomycetota bacterium]